MSDDRVEARFSFADPGPPLSDHAGDRLVIKYLGSKRTLLPGILDAVRACAPLRAGGSGAAVLDLFSGTSRVGHALKRAGYRVISNDHNAYAATLARCYVQSDSQDVLRDAEALVRELNALPGSAGYFTETFCVRSRFIQPFNGERIDAIREAIARKSLEPELESVLLVSLMEAADRVDSTTGVQMAYLKSWAPRSFNPLELRVPDVLPRARSGKGRAHQLDALEAAARFGRAADVVYIDPPYNQHSYLGNYHVWESLVRWDKPEVYGTACKRVDCRQRRSAFNSRPGALGALGDVLRAAQAPTIILSLNDEGYVSRAEVETLLRETAGPDGRVEAIATPFKRYVGAQIGVYNPRGKKVGVPGRLENTELLFIAQRARDEDTPHAAPARGSPAGALN